MALDGVVEAAFAGMRVTPIGVTLTGLIRPQGKEEPDDTAPAPTVRKRSGSGGGASSPPESETPKSPDTKPAKKAKKGGKQPMGTQAEEEAPPVDPLAPSDSSKAKKNLQAFAMELIKTDPTKPLALDDGSVASQWARAVQELSAYKVGRYVKSAEAYEEARKLAAEDMDQLFKDAQTDRIVVRDEQREMWSDSKWEVMHESDRAKRWLVDGLTRTAMVRMAKSAEKRAVPDARSAVRVGIELHEFAEEYAHLPTLLNTLNESLRGFLNRPLFLNDKDTMFNFLILGQAGVGKTRLGTKMGELLSHFGLYLYDKMKVASRSDFVADFEGQTSNKVRGFLAANQERVLFLDEAYSLTTYEPMKPGQEKKDRKLTPYSQEAIDGLNQYLSENAGTGCFIAAGYPKEMREEFLPANKGLVRRFLSTIHIQNYTSEQLVAIYLSSLAGKLSKKGQEPISPQHVATFFTRPALGLLAEVIEATWIEPPSQDVKPFRQVEADRAADAGEEVHDPIDGVELDKLAKIFEDQASSMVTLADLTAMLIWTSPRYGKTKLGVSNESSRQATWAIGARDMTAIIVGQLRKQLGEVDAPIAEEQLVDVLEYYGWRNAGTGEIAAPQEFPWRRVPLPVKAAQMAEIAQQKQLLAKADAMYEAEQERLRAAEAARQAAIEEASRKKALEEKKERENLPEFTEAARKAQEEREVQQEADRRARGKARELAKKRQEQEDKEFDRRFGKGAAALRRELSAPYSKRNQKGGKSTRAVWGWTGALGSDDGD